MSSSTMPLSCPACGASYAREHDSCESRFDTLLALDHSRQEPWGSRHGQAFAAFVLQHPDRHPASLDHAWAALYQIYVVGDAAADVFDTLRASHGTLPATWSTPPRPQQPLQLPHTTILDLDDFAPATYPSHMDRWCRAALRMWGV